MRFSAACLLIMGASQAATLHVPDDYSTIQAAISAALSGDTVLVSAGDYLELLTISKPISLIGEPTGAVRVYQTSHSGNLVLISGGPSGQVYIRGIVFETAGRIIDCDVAPLVLQECTIRDGHTPLLGAGIACSNSPYLAIHGCLVEYNWSTEGNGFGGGGMFLYNVGEVVITNSRIEHNVAYDIMDGHERGTANGGGIYATGLTSLTISNSSISENQAYGYGGGIRCGTDLLTLHNCLFINNLGAMEPTTLKAWVYREGDLRNCIFYGNEHASWFQIQLISSFDPEITYCDIEDSADAVYGSFTWGPGNIDQDPLFESGPLSEYHLSSGSPCIDAGDPDPSFNDPEDPANPGYALWPALGLLRNDMGAYGGGGSGYWVGTAEESSAPITKLSLLACPNPCASISALLFELPEPGPASLVIFDASGHMIRSLAEGEFTAGVHTAVFDGSDIPSGVYLCRLQAGASSATTRVVLIR